MHEITLGDGHILEARVVGLQSSFSDGKMRTLKKNSMYHNSHTTYHDSSIERQHVSGVKCLMLMKSWLTQHVRLEVSIIWTVKLTHNKSMLLTANVLKQRPSRKAEFAEASKELTCWLWPWRIKGDPLLCQFPSNGGKRSEEPLGLVHSDVCVKINTKSLGGTEYFVDKKIQLVWVYVV